MKKIHISLIALPFAMFWPMAMLSKTMQLGLFLLLAICLVMKYGITSKCNGFEICQLFYLLIYFLAGMLSVANGQHNSDRVLATLNTIAINCLGLLYFHIYRTSSIKESEYNKIYKYSFINLAILILLYITFACTNLLRNIVISGNSICAVDYVSGGTGIRFNGFLSYSNMVVFTVLFFYPLSLKYLNNKKLLSLLLSITLCFVIKAAHSRSGVIIYLALLVIYIVCGNQEAIFRVLKKRKSLVLGGGFALLIGIVILREDALLKIINKVLFMRVGSNSMRIYIYTESIRKMLTQSPLLGMGIKDMTEYGYPYGSHSTYIGVFYKAGILGGIVYVISIIMATTNIIKKHSKNSCALMVKLSLIAILVLMIIEDIDGTNWSMILFNISLAFFYSRHNLSEKFNLNRIR